MDIKDGTKRLNAAKPYHAILRQSRRRRAHAMGGSLLELPTEKVAPKKLPGSQSRAVWFSAR